jgi:L-alanine-DL-glutamate epimerase-like enolase superfamily enzyme
MIERLRNDVYAFVQPDASVVGGISAVMEVFTAARAHGTGVVVHAWGGVAAIMASYHAAFAAGGEPVEYPMLDFPLGAEMTGDQGRIEVGLTLTPQMEARYPFDPSAVYSCVLHDWGPPPDSYWSA